MAFQLIDRVAVEDEGEGDAVVCVHGLGGSSQHLDAADAGAGAAPRDPRRPARQRPLAARRGRALDRALSSRRCWRSARGWTSTRAHWLGHSMGTIVCQHIAAAQPKLVASLALFGPLIAPPDAARTAMRARAAKARDEGAAGMHEIALGAAARPRSRPTRAQRPPLAVAFVRESLMRQDGDGLRAQLRGAGRRAGRRRSSASRRRCCSSPATRTASRRRRRCAPWPTSCTAQRARASSCCRAAATGRRSSGPRNAQRELREFLAAQR